MDHRGAPRVLLRHGTRRTIFRAILLIHTNSRIRGARDTQKFVGHLHAQSGRVEWGRLAISTTRKVNS